MAVYTVLDLGQMRDLTAPYCLGQLKALEGVADGVENTNYFLTLQGDNGRERHFLFTVFEHLQRSELIFYLRWLEHLHCAGLPVAPAVTDAQGGHLMQVGERPAALFPKLQGSHPRSIDPPHCRAIGDALGRLHTVTTDLDHHHAGPRSLDWLMSLSHTVLPLLNADDQALLQRGLDATHSLRQSTGLATGLIHGDLFPDNTLFVEHHLTGLVDFFSGGEGWLGFDLAVCINAWCSREDGSLCTEHCGEMRGAYAMHRTLSTEEQRLLPALLVLAALRFWVSRLASAHTDSDERNAGELVHTKDPDEYRSILRHRLAALPR